MAKQEKAALGIDLGGTSIKFGLVAPDGSILQKTSLPSLAEDGPEAVINQIKNGIRELLSGSHKIAGIGVGAPGCINAKKGTVENPPNLPGWGKVQLGKILEKEFSKDVYVENDANAAAIGEMVFGAGKDLSSFVMITLGTGVGGGIILKRKIYRGESGAAGEIGHITIDYNGPRCNCGSYGCIEAYIGNGYMTKRVASELGKHSNSKIFEFLDYDISKLSPFVISQAAEAEDEYAMSIISDCGEKLGAALASLCNLLDVTDIVIGGGVAGFGKLLFEATLNSTKRRVLESLRPQINLFPALLQNEAGIIGASSLVFYNR